MADDIQQDIYAPVIEELEARIAGLQATIDNLQALRGGGVPMGTPAKKQAEVKTDTFSNDSFFGMTAGDAAKKFLAAKRKTQTVAAISEALIAGGWMTTSKNVNDNIRTILSRHPDFVRINSEFGLAEWYPGRKKPFTRSANASQAEESEQVSDEETTTEDSTEPSPPSEQ